MLIFDLEELGFFLRTVLFALLANERRDSFAFEMSVSVDFTCVADDVEVFA